MQWSELYLHLLEVTSSSLWLTQPFLASQDGPGCRTGLWGHRRLGLKELTPLSLPLPAEHHPCQGPLVFSLIPTLAPQTRVFFPKTMSLSVQAPSQNAEPRRQLSSIEQDPPFPPSMFPSSRTKPALTRLLWVAEQPGSTAPRAAIPCWMPSRLFQGRPLFWAVLPMCRTGPSRFECCPGLVHAADDNTHPAPHFVLGAPRSTRSPGTFLPHGLVFFPAWSIRRQAREGEDRLTATKADVKEGERD